MKKYLFSALVTLAGLFVLAASSQAQTGDILVQIKQDFTAGGKALPAGTYKVFRSVTGTDQILILRGQQSERIDIPHTNLARRARAEAAGSEVDASGRRVLPVPKWGLNLGCTLWPRPGSRLARPRERAATQCFHPEATRRIRSTQSSGDGKRQGALALAVCAIEI